MKKQALFESAIGIIGLIMWIIYVRYDIKIFWVILPMVVSGVCAIPLWYNRADFAVPEDFKPAFKKNNIISLCVTLACAIIAYLSIMPCERINGWDLWAYFVVYVFVLSHGMGLFVAYQKFCQKK